MPKLSSSPPINQPDVHYPRPLSPLSFSNRNLLPTKYTQPAQIHLGHQQKHAEDVQLQDGSFFLQPREFQSSHMSPGQKARLPTPFNRS
ncbi:hypothetical protein BofuT4_uP080510.1 [Botrytis cinerea T4]|uniref:Uncharacterized protein n=1 Tax=Botryotinia fuckeliana (strain T4) TaxID=999810 RepID=G2YKV8_BOTF4|nr:hypothetical protein BofuT4_uP080510.1 [Botrytis cinerea T4]